MYEYCFITSHTQKQVALGSDVCIAGTEDKKKRFRDRYFLVSNNTTS